MAYFLCPHFQSRICVSMKLFLFTTSLALLSLLNVLNAQDSMKLTKNDSIPNKIDTVKMDLANAIPSAI